MWVRNAIYYSIGHYFVVRKLLPVFPKPEVLIGDLPNVYNIAYTFGKNAIFTTFRPLCKNLGGRGPPVPIPSNLLFHTCNIAANNFRPRLTTLEFTGKRECAKKQKSESRNFSPTLMSIFSKSLRQIAAKIAVIVGGATRC